MDILSFYIGFVTAFVAIATGSIIELFYLRNKYGFPLMKNKEYKFKQFGGGK